MATSIRISAVLRATISKHAAHVAGVISEIAAHARSESIHYALALASIEALWLACDKHVGTFDAAMSELAADVHATCEANGISIGRRVKGDDGENDDDAARRERGRVNTFLSQLRVIARKYAAENGEFDLSQPFWKCYEASKKAGSGSNRSKNKATTPAVHPAAELAKALGEAAEKDDAALRELFHALTHALQARKATIDVSAVVAIGKRFAA